MKKTKHIKITAARFIFSCIAAIFILSALPTAMAASVQPVVPISTAAAADGEASPAADDTVWIYRDYNGKTQKRLWSNIEARWLTDWIDCE